MLLATLLVAAGIWAGGPSDQVAGQRPAANLRAQGKAFTVQAEKLLPAKMDKELACGLQAEKMAVKEAHQEKDAATLEVIIEAASPLIHGYLEGLGLFAEQSHPKVAGPSHPPTAMAIQLPVVVA